MRNILVEKKFLKYNVGFSSSEPFPKQRDIEPHDQVIISFIHALQAMVFINGGLSVVADNPFIGSNAVYRAEGHATQHIPDHLVDNSQSIVHHALRLADLTPYRNTPTQIKRISFSDINITNNNHKIELTPRNGTEILPVTTEATAKITIPSWGKGPKSIEDTLHGNIELQAAHAVFNGNRIGYLVRVKQTLKPESHDLIRKEITITKSGFNTHAIFTKASTGGKVRNPGGSDKQTGGYDIDGRGDDGRW